MAVLNDYEFELAGFVFGAHTSDVTVEKWSPAAVSYRTSDVDNSQRDGRRMGRDYRNAGTWSFDLSTDRDDIVGSLEALARARRAWNGDSVRDTPSAVVELRYAVAGRTRKVFGRPRRFSAPPENLALQGYIPITADFELTDPRHFGDDQQEIEITAVPSAVGGLVTPLVTPLTTLASSVPRISGIVVGGDVATDLIVEIDGPMTNAYLLIGDIRVDLKGNLDAGRTIRIDARPWVNAATFVNPDGSFAGSAAGLLARTTKLKALQQLEPGTHPVTFGGIDATGTARARVLWTPAYESI